MKICYISNSDIHTEKLTSWFSQKDNDIHLITSDFKNIDGITNHHIHHDNGQPINFIRNIIQTRKLVKKIKPDILHAHYAFGYGTFGAFANFHPFILSPWGSDILIEPEQSKIKKFLIKYSLKKADLITCDGENVFEKVLEIDDKYSKKIYLVYHGVNIDTFHYDKKDTNLIEKYKSNHPVIISTRHLIPLYDVETLIRSIPFVTKKYQNAKFIIVGKHNSYIKNNKYINYLKEIVNILQVSNNVEFIGEVDNNKLPYYLTVSDIYVSTSLSDGGIAISILEAMSCKLSSIVTDVGNNSKWIKNDENGFIIPIKNQEILAEKIIYLIENEDVRKKFGNNSRKIIVEKQNYEKQMKKLENVYLSSLKR